MRTQPVYSEETDIDIDSLSRPGGTHGISDMKKIIMFGFNFPHNFIETIFGDDQNLAKHLMGKFKDAYSKFGSTGAFFKFYTELDYENQNKIEDWIKQNYKG